MRCMGFNIKKETMKLIIERLKVCWYVLTYRNFFFAAYKSDEKMLIENDQQEITGVKDKSIRGWYHIDDVAFSGDIPTLRYLICENIIGVVNKIKNNEL